MLNLIDPTIDAPTTTIDETPVKRTFVLHNVVTIQKISYDDVWVEAENEEQARELAEKALMNEWSNATEPVKGEINIIEVESIAVSDDVEESDDEDSDEEGDEDENEDTENPEAGDVAESPVVGE